MNNNLNEAGVIQQGLDLMVYGMGSVFVFLTLLVIGTMLMSRAVAKFFPEQVSTSLNTGSKPKRTVITVPTDKQAFEQKYARELVVIKEAISQHRAKA